MNGASKPLPLLTELEWIAERAEEPAFKYWTLAHHITVELLEHSFWSLRHEAAAGVDGQTAKQYAVNLSENLTELHKRLKELRYRAPAVKRVWIPKGESETERRPLGIPTLEDKVVQKAVLMLLEGIYEAEFSEASYGYRKGKSPHQALNAVWQQTMNGMQWVIDADISGYFTSINHAQLKEFIQERVEDRSIIRFIGKWLKAGVLEDGALTYPSHGTPQGGVISPLLANIYLHYVLDKWFAEEVKPRLRGKAHLVRYADDFIIGCEREDDARRIMKVLPKRFEKYHLTLHPEKTRLLNFQKPGEGAAKGQSTFDFLGFRLYWGKSRRGNWVVKQKTAPTRQRRTMKRIACWCKGNRHWRVKEQHRALCAKLKGHYNYFGLTGNIRQLRRVVLWTERQWHRWLNSRGGKRRSWDEFKTTILARYPLPPAKIVHSVMATRTT